MKKVLIQAGVLLQALGQGNTVCCNVIEKCVNDPNVQAWILAGTIQKLAEAGIDAERICTSLAKIPKIPVNHRLTHEALNSSKPFETALELAAAKMFKLSTIISSDQSSEIDGISIVSYQAFMDTDYSDESGKINFMDLTLPVHSIFDQVDGWYMEIIQNTAFAGGNHVGAFEKEFADYCGTNYAIGTSNGTEALLFCLLAMGVKPGDEIITVPNTFIATTEAISQAGAVPVFVDVSPESYNMDPRLIEEKITSKTKLILPVHLYGQIADMEAISAIAQKHDLKVLEDACQAHGAVYKGKRAGSFGDAAAFSMYPGKNLGAFGEAGCISTNDETIDRMVRLLRDHGQSTKYYHDVEGYNGRMDNLQAAALRAKLPYMDGWNDQRRKAARTYQEHLKNIEQVIYPQVASEESAHVFHVYVIRVPEPQKLHEYLKAKGIFTAFHYPVPLHKQKAYQNLGAAQGNYPVTEECAEGLLTLPMFPELTEKQIIRICSEIKRFHD